jgi:undecaprenyl-diphosphatase
MIEQLDKNIFLFLNGFHNPFFDIVFYSISNRFIWIPLYVFIIYLLIRKFKRASVPVIFFSLLLILITDQLSVHLFKNVFHRLRPCQDPSLTGLVHTVYDSCGGLYGFLSSHAANTFAFAGFI